MQKATTIETSHKGAPVEPIVISTADLENVAAGAVDSVAACGTGGTRTCGKQIQER